MKKCLPLIFRELQMKTIMSFHLTLNRMFYIKKAKYNTFWEECRKKGSLKYWKCKSVQPS